MEASTRSRLTLVAVAALLATSAVGAGDEASPNDPRPVVVVELFTSQGCSSCPTADRVLSRLGREDRADGVSLVPLAFHVDYWNRIGWIDPFSSPRWSARQRRYAGVFGLRSVYTPQVVLNGRAELVGSRESRLRSKIPGAVPSSPVGRVEILRATLDGTATELVVDLAAELEQPAAGSPLVANLALYESGLVTRIESGENALLTLENDYVVRLLMPAIVFEPGQSARREGARIALDSNWVVGNLGLVAFLQDAETLEIHAAVVFEEIAPVAAGPSLGTGDGRSASRSG